MNNKYKNKAPFGFHGRPQSATRAMPNFLRIFPTGSYHRISLALVKVGLRLFTGYPMEEKAGGCDLT
jgi:hypothetical protein